MNMWRSRCRKAAIGVLIWGPLLGGGPLQGRLAAQERAVESGAVIIVMPKKGALLPALSPKDFKIEVNSKSAEPISVVPLQAERSGLELMVLIDDGAAASLANQNSDLKRFVDLLPVQAKVGVAYMQNGRAVIAQPLTPERALTKKAFRIPRSNAGSNASPYFCLSDLAKHWPSRNPDVRREVLMVTDGADQYGGASFDPENPYVLAAIADSQRAGLIVHSIFYRDADGAASQFTGPFSGQSTGQNYLLMVSRSSGGQSYYQLSGNPVAFAPYLTDLHNRLMNQYELGFYAKGRGRAGLQSFKVKANLKNVSIDAPEKVLIGRGGESPLATP